jgi:hypothetical protein
VAIDVNRTGKTMQFTGPSNSVLNSTTAGHYMQTTLPRQLGLTMRLDF